MSDISGYIADCERVIAQSRLVQRHYPEARRHGLFPDGLRVWCAAKAHENATGVDILIGEDSLKRPAAFFCAYHELREREGEDDEIRVRVYSDDWPQKVADWDVADRIRRDPELLAATLAALRKGRP